MMLYVVVVRCVSGIVSVVRVCVLDNADQFPEFLMRFLLGDGGGFQVLGPPHLTGGWRRNLGWGVAPKVDALGCVGAAVGLVGGLDIISCLQKLLPSLWLLSFLCVGVGFLVV